jgi:HSP20 family molecular chaperone IbpA
MRGEEAMRQDVQTSSSDGRGTSRRAEGSERQQPEQRQPYIIPPVDVFENEHGITLRADMPGVSRDGLGVRVDGDNLIIEATASSASPENMELIYGEARHAAYRRQFTLSRELDTARIEAQLKDGVLQLSIPRAEEAKPRRIQVSVG